MITWIPLHTVGIRVDIKGFISDEDAVIHGLSLVVLNFFIG
jgi:hypothetical protein